HLPVKASLKNSLSLVPIPKKLPIRPFILYASITIIKPGFPSPLRSPSRPHPQNDRNLLRSLLPLGPRHAPRQDLQRSRRRPALLPPPIRLLRAPQAPQPTHQTQTYRSLIRSSGI